MVYSGGLEYRKFKFQIKLGSEYWQFEYWKHLNTNFWKFRFEIVRYSNGLSMGFILCTRLTIRILDQNIRNQDGISIFPLFKWLGCPVFNWHLNTGPYGIHPVFDHLNTELFWYSDTCGNPAFERTRFRFCRKKWVPSFYYQLKTIFSQIRQIWQLFIILIQPVPL